jgi:hypothetical protein
MKALAVPITQLDYFGHLAGGHQRVKFVLDSRLMLGSVASAVVAHAGYRVLVVR